MSSDRYETYLSRTSHGISSKTRAEIKRDAIDRYGEVWDVFYAWKQEDSSSRIRDLAERGMRATDHQEALPRLTSSTQISSLDWSACPPASTPERYLQPTPKYDACSLTHRNIWEAENLPAMFIPYADDEEFPMRKYVEEHDELAWSDLVDPDTEIIQLETYTRLRVENEFSDMDINQSEVLLKTTKEAVPTTGPLYSVSQRDLLPWEHRSLARLEGFEAYGRPERSFAEVIDRVNDQVIHFCPSLNCLTSACATHAYQRKPLSPAGPVSIKDSEADPDAAPCGDTCFQKRRHPSPSNWSSADHSEFNQVLQLIPRTTPPCALSVICRKPCFEIYYYLTQQPEPHNREDVLDEGNIPATEVPTSAGIKMITIPTQVIIPAPCDHAGPCTVYADCACFRNRAYCERNCRCENTCNLRFKGCRCKNACPKKPSRRHRRKKCPCRSNGRECDPERCISCNARDYLGAGSMRKRTCTNTIIQQGSKHALLVTRGEYGLGAFAQNDIKEGELIAEYVGTKGWDYGNAKGLLTTYTGRNYMFAVEGLVQDEKKEQKKQQVDGVTDETEDEDSDNDNTTKLREYQQIDGETAGNEARYLNDANNGRHLTDQEELAYHAKINCEAGTSTVNGDHRIALVATRRICEGEELLLSYGDSYWKNT